MHCVTFPVAGRGHWPQTRKQLPGQVERLHLGHSPQVVSARVRAAGWALSPMLWQDRGSLQWVGGKPGLSGCWRDRSETLVPRCPPSLTPPAWVILLWNPFTMGSLRSAASMSVSSLFLPPKAVLLVGTPRAALGLAVLSDTVTKGLAPQGAMHYRQETEVGYEGRKGERSQGYTLLTRANSPPATSTWTEGKGTLAREEGMWRPEPRVAQIQLGDQVGPVVAEVTTHGAGVWRETGRHSQVLASARERQANCGHL